MAQICSESDNNGDTGHVETIEDCDNYNEFLSRMFKHRKDNENNRSDLDNNFVNEMSTEMLTPDVTNALAQLSETDEKTVAHILKTIVDVIVQIDEYDTMELDQSDHEQYEDMQSSYNQELENLNCEHHQRNDHNINSTTDVFRTSTPINSTVEHLNSSVIFTKLHQEQQETPNRSNTTQNTPGMTHNLSSTDDMTLSQQITQSRPKERPGQETFYMLKLDEQVQCYKCHETMPNKTNLISHLKGNNCLKIENVKSDIVDIQLHPLITEQKNNAQPATEESLKNSILAQSESCEEVGSIGHVNRPNTSQNTAHMICHNQSGYTVENNESIFSINHELISSSMEESECDYVNARYRKEGINSSPADLSMSEEEINQHEVECSMCDGLFSTNHSLEIHKELDHQPDKYVLSQDIDFHDADPAPPNIIQKLSETRYNIKGANETIAHIMKRRQGLVDPPKKKESSIGDGLFSYSHGITEWKWAKARKTYSKHDSQGSPGDSTVTHSIKYGSRDKKKLDIKRKYAHSEEEIAKEGIELIWNQDPAQMTSPHKSQTSKNISFLIKETGTKEEDLRIIKVDNSVSEVTFDRLRRIFYHLADEIDIDTHLIDTGTIRIGTDIDKESLDSIIQFIKSHVKGERMTVDGVAVSSEHATQIFEMVAKTLYVTGREEKTKRKYHPTYERRKNCGKYKKYTQLTLMKALDKIRSKELSMKEASTLYKIPYSTIQVATSSNTGSGNASIEDRRTKTWRELQTPPVHHPRSRSGKQKKKKITEK